MKKLSHLFNFNRVLIIGTVLVILSIIVPSAFAQNSDLGVLQQVATGTPGTPEATVVGTPTGTVVPELSATEVFHYGFSSLTDECGWGASDGQVRFGKLFVSPGFNLAKWLAYNPYVGLDRLQALNPGLSGGIQFDCRAIELPSM